MQKLVWTLLALFVLSSISVSAAVECKDLDEQPDIEDTLDTTALVEYGIEDKADHCVSGKDGFTVSSGAWVREYYCDGEPEQRKYKDFDCTRQGFEKCDGGKCVGGTTASPTQSNTPSAGPACGNKKIDTIEQCDPPDSICYSEGKIGICTRPNSAGLGGCQCKVYKSGGTAEPEAEEEKNATAAPPAEEKPPVKEEPPAEVQEEEEQAPEEPATPPTEEERKPLPEEKFDEPAGISVTRSITNTVKKFFRWIGSLF
jgi:hypothetical protein